MLTWINGCNVLFYDRLASFKIHQVMSSPAKYSTWHTNDIHVSCEVSFNILLIIE